jgi:hypothetical protein
MYIILSIISFLCIILYVFGMFIIHRNFFAILFHEFWGLHYKAALLEYSEDFLGRCCDSLACPCGSGYWVSFMWDLCLESAETWRCHGVGTSSW